MDYSGKPGAITNDAACTGDCGTDARVSKQYLPASAITLGLPLYVLPVVCTRGMLHMLDRGMPLMWGHIFELYRMVWGTCMFEIRET